MQLNTILENIRTKLGIEQLNEMQQLMTETTGNNILLLAPTGSGKTIAFTVRMLRALGRSSTGHVQAVVLAPSRELVLQSAEVIRKLSDCRVLAFYGGHSMTDEKNSLSVTPDIIVATPGRLLDHISRGQISLADVSSLVVDEYDKMLDAGFQDEMRRIVKTMRNVGLRILTSATRLEELPPFFGNIDDYIVFDFAGKGNEPRSNTAIVEVPSATADKLETLIDLLRSLDNQKVIVFVNHRESAERVFEALKKAKLPVGLYHGGMEQERRRQAVDLLQNETTPILVATDIAARGLDIADVGSVVHYHLPVNEQTWIHRNGRTARMGAEGTVYVIVNEKDNIPDYIDFDRKYYPVGQSANPIEGRYLSLYFDAGKREKISKGDIAGFLMQKGGLSRDDLGLITLADHYALAAVRRDKTADALELLRPYKLKNKRVRVTLLKS